MKSYFRWLLVGLVIAVLTACSGGGSNNVNSINNTSNEKNKTYELKNGNHALMGPLKNATVNIYKLNDINKSIATVKTDELGTFKFNKIDANDSDLLLVTVSGGYDIDANDDGVLDKNPTENKGTIHGFATAKDIKEGKVNVTLLSEIVYQYSKHLIGKVYQEDFKSILNNLSSKIIKQKSNNGINYYKIITNFNPIKDKAILDINYSKMISGKNSLVYSFYNDGNNTEIENKITKIFKGFGLSLRNMRLINNTKYSKIILEKPFKSNIISNGSTIFVNLENSTSKLEDYVLKGKKITFSIEPNEDVKIIDWEGCDKVSEDLKNCQLTVTDSIHKVVPYVVFKETQYADNVKNLTSYQVNINDNNYTVTLDLNASSQDKDFLNNIKVDDIIISTNSKQPFFRKVTKIEKVDDNNYIFSTQPVSFLKLYKQGSIFVNRYLTHEDLVATTNSRNRVLLYKPHNGMRLLPPKHKYDDTFTLVFDNYKINRGFGDTSHELNWKVNDFITLSGSISFKLKPEFSYNVEWFNLKSLRFAVTKEMKVKLSIKASAEGKLDSAICEALGKPKDCNKLKLGRIAKYDFYIPGSPIFFDIELDASALIEANLEQSIEIGGEYTVTTKRGFNFVNNNISIINDSHTNGAIIGEMKNTNFSSGQYLLLSPIVLINGIAGVELETKMGLYEECSLISVSNSNTDIDTNFGKGKIDVKAGAQLTWAWNDFLAKFSWAKKFQNKLNTYLKNINYSYSYNIYEWNGLEVGKRPAHLKLIPAINTKNIKYNDESINRHYQYKIINDGEQKLKWKVELSGDLSDSISISPKEGELDKNDYVVVDVYLQNDDLTSEIGNHKVKLKFINLSNPNVSDTQNGTTTDTISLRVIERLNKPTNFQVTLIGESIKKLKFNWTKSLPDNLSIFNSGYSIYMSDYNNTTNSCSNNYLKLISVPKNYDNYTAPFDYFSNELKAGKKYCFKLSAYKIIVDFDGLFINHSPFSNVTILEIPAYAILKSYITDVNNNPIENAKIHLTSLATNTVSDGNGNYVFRNLLPGRYKITVEADGYLPVTGFVTLSAGETKTFVKQLLVDNSLDGVEGVIAGKVKDATNGNGISNAILKVRKGINNTSGEVIKSIETDGNGNYNISLNSGTYTISVTANGYTQASYIVNVVGNQSKQKDLTLSPILPEGYMRIVLSWGANPSDLDSHLVRLSGNQVDYHVYYNDKNPSNSDAYLDVDDISSYGPETITINNLDSSKIYRYYVHDFSNRTNHNDTALKSSSAKVDVYYGDQIKTFYVPNETGNAWKVFEVVNGEIIPCVNNCVFGVDSQTDSQIGSRSLNRDENQYIFESLPNK